MPRRKSLLETGSQLLRAIGQLKAEQAVLDRFIDLRKFEKDVDQRRNFLTMQEGAEGFSRSFGHVFRGRIHSTLNSHVS
ncbi:hypothetical protein QTH97_36730 [Variovorax sp. J22R24]|uniref:hypothetical protein n=1 Tax=Variovorax gracilis TaxID=3053502 RepID=UPI002574A304|nr:hypothetical protein [Variovorax sp. J22R24]MDM0110471.1 hypothetical protein [Variovorax sp. J22R24]